MSTSLDTIVSRAKRKGFVYPNSEIYGGLANMRDYGPYGSLLKKNIVDLRTKYFVQERSDVVYMDTTILAHPTTRVASGHVGGFSDALIDDKNTGQRFRADKIIEAYIEDELQKEKKLFNKEIESYIRSGSIEGLKHGERIKEAFGMHSHYNWDHIKNKDNSGNLPLEYIANKYQEKYKFTNLSPEARGNEGMHAFIVGEKLRNPTKNKDADRTEVRQFNLMLSSHLGPIADDASKVYLRPETCQSLFTDFKQVCDTTRMRVPFGLAQVGKAFRNEITPGQFLYRTREFEQMEIEFFVPADLDEAQRWFTDWKEVSMKYRQDVIKISPENLRFKDHDKLAHYAAAATDIEYQFPRGFGEIQGIHNRTDFDLKQHQEHSKQSMQYTDPKTGARYIPRCVEASFGLGRTFMVALLEFYDEDVVKEGDTRVVVRFPFDLAPIKYAILPLMDKDEAMVNKAEELFHRLRKTYSCEFDTGGNIGKRYRRQDEIGTPYCVTIDHQTLEDGTVTVRDRDTMEQVRVQMDEVGLKK